MGKFLSGKGLSSLQIILGFIVLLLSTGAGYGGSVVQHRVDHNTLEHVSRQSESTHTDVEVLKRVVNDLAQSVKTDHDNMSQWREHVTEELSGIRSDTEWTKQFVQNHLK